MDGTLEDNSEMVELNETLLIITLNVHWLNIPIKRQILPIWLKSQYSTICSLQKDTDWD